MKSSFQTLRGLALAAFIIVGANVRAASPYFFVQQPESIIAEIGTFAAFSAKVSHPPGAVFQWQAGKFSGTNFYWNDIADKTNHDLFVTSPSVDDVAGYRLRASWGPTNITSAEAYLSVYELHPTNSTAGTLTTSSQLFITAAAYQCPSPPTRIYTFNRYYIPVSSGNWCYFYGPNVPTSAQVPPFINSGHNRFVELTTSGSYNLPSPTAIRLYESFDPPTINECGCEEGDSKSLPWLDYFSMSASTSDLLARYRVTIYYNVPPGVSTGNVVLNWKYFD